MVFTSHTLLASCGGRVGDISPNPLCAYLGISWGDLTYLYVCIPLSLSLSLSLYIYIYISVITHTYGNTRLETA